MACFGTTAITSSETELAVLNTAISNEIDNLCGPVVQRSVTETHDGGRDTIRLRRRPVAAVTALDEYQSTTPTALTSDSVTLHNQAGFVLRGTEGRVTRRSGGSTRWFASGDQNVVVTYVAGRVAVTSSSGAETFKQAAGIMAKDVWRGVNGQGTETFGAAFDPETGALLLGPELLNKVRALLYRELEAPVIG